MNKTLKFFLELILALVLAAALLLFTKFIANKVYNSAFLAQSKVLGNLLTEDSVNLAEIVKKPGTIKVTQKFLSALTDAYINFELIPYREGKTLITILDSLVEGVEIETLNYSGKDLIITGSSNDFANYYKFIDQLDSSQYFKGVNQSYAFTESGIEFIIICRGTYPSYHYELPPKTE